MNLSRPGRPGANRSAGVFGWNIFLLTCALAVSSAGRAWAQQDAAATPATPAVAAPAPGDDRIRLNFRGVSLDMVLEYLSEAAGFIIIKETEVKGKVDVWSNQPLTKEEAIEVLNTVLNKHDYAAIRNGRTLTIVSRDDAKKRDIPVKRGAEAEEIPKSDQMVTQVVPVSRANATQLVNNLRPLLGTYAEMTVNESANTLVITATQADIKRMAEIINALDESISSTSSIKVHPLRYADAKEIATVVRDVFAPAATQQNNNQARTQFGGFGGGFPGAAFGGAAFGGGGGAGGAGGAAGGAGGTGRGGAAAGRGGSSGGAQTVRVVAVADERSNSVIVGAPPDLLPTITGMIGELDQEVNDITELRVFTLKNSDATEVANLLTSLFPDETQTSGGGSQPQLQFNRGGFGGRSGGTAAAQSQRMKKQGRVLAVPDARTGSVIVSAASEMMPQIADMIAQLDGSGARKQKVFVYSLENADPQQVGQIVQDMFQRNTTTANRNTANQNSALSSRIQSNNQALSTGTGNTGLGTTGFGNTGLGGGRTR